MNLLLLVSWLYSYNLPGHFYYLQEWVAEFKWKERVSYILQKQLNNHWLLLTKSCNSEQPVVIKVEIGHATPNPYWGCRVILEKITWENICHVHFFHANSIDQFEFPDYYLFSLIFGS